MSPPSEVFTIRFPCRIASSGCRRRSSGSSRSLHGHSRHRLLLPRRTAVGALEQLEGLADRVERRGVRLLEAEERRAEPATCVQVTAPSVVRWISPPEVAKQVVSLVQSRSVAGGMAGTAVRRVNVWPPSAVESTALLASTVPDVRRREREGPTGDGQLRSLAENGSRWNVAPPSSDRRSEQPPPTTIRSASRPCVPAEVE